LKVTVTNTNEVSNFETGEKIGYLEDFKYKSYMEAVTSTHIDNNTETLREIAIDDKIVVHDMDNNLFFLETVSASNINKLHLGYSSTFIRLVGVLK